MKTIEKQVPIHLKQIDINRADSTVELQWLEHGWLVYHGYFEHVIESLTQKIP